jgi:hypothetical protein
LIACRRPKRRRVGRETPGFTPRPQRPEPRRRQAKPFRGRTPAVVRASARNRGKRRGRNPDANTPAPGAAQPVREAAIRFPPKPDRPDPQSQSFSRSYGSDLPTSLTYINLSTRGCSPRRPDADMGTNRREGTHSRPRVFKFQTGAARTPQEPRRSSEPRPSLRPTRFTRPSAP